MKVWKMKFLFKGGVSYPKTSSKFTSNKRGVGWKSDKKNRILAKMCVSRNLGVPNSKSFCQVVANDRLPRTAFLKCKLAPVGFIENTTPGNDHIYIYMSAWEKENHRLKSALIKGYVSSQEGTLPETNIAPESLGLEDEFPFGKAYFQVLCWCVLGSNHHMIHQPM